MEHVDKCLFAMAIVVSDLTARSSTLNAISVPTYVTIADDGISDIDFYVKRFGKVA